MALYGCPIWIVLVWLFLLGAVVGSFLNVCIHRFPQHDRLADQLRSLGRVPSHCPRCKQHIRWFDNLPIVGWLKLGGRCRNCRGRIPVRYPLVELLTAVLFVVVYWHQVPGDLSATINQSGLYWRLGPRGEPGSTLLSNSAILHWRYALHMVMICGLIVATFIDFDLRIIPDGSTIPAMLIAIVGSCAVGRVYLVPVWFQSPHLMHEIEFVYGPFPDWLQTIMNWPELPAWIARHPHLHGLAVSLAGLVVGGGMVWAVRIVGAWVMRREAMGFGDVILMAMVGACIGWQPVVVAFFIAPLCALGVTLVMLVVRREGEIPYGPYLSLGTLILLLGWQPIWLGSRPHWRGAESVFSLGPLIPVIAVLGVVILAGLLLFAQAVKRLLGIPLYPSMYSEQWTRGDHLFYYGNQSAAEEECSCREHQQPGACTTLGGAPQHRWRCSGSDGWQQNWQRRRSI